MKVDLFYRSVGEGEVFASVQVEMMPGDNVEGLTVLDQAVKQFREDLVIILSKNVPTRIREVLDALPEGKEFGERP